MPAATEIGTAREVIPNFPSDPRQLLAAHKLRVGHTIAAQAIYSETLPVGEPPAPDDFVVPDDLSPEAAEHLGSSIATVAAREIGRMPPLIGRVIFAGRHYIHLQPIVAQDTTSTVRLVPRGVITAAPPFASAFRTGEAADGHISKLPVAIAEGHLHYEFWTPYPKSVRSILGTWRNFLSTSLANMTKRR